MKSAIKDHSNFLMIYASTLVCWPMKLSPGKIRMACLAGLIAVVVWFPGTITLAASAFAQNTKIEVPADPRVEAQAAPAIPLQSVDTSGPRSEEIHPLQSVDRSSPRSTLLTFVKILDAAYVEVLELKTSYFNSGNLYFSESEIKQLARIHEKIRMASRALDVSKLSPETIILGELKLRRTLQLHSILDRLQLPLPEDIPNNRMLEHKFFKQWSIPGTSIVIQLIKEGPRAGEFLFSADTVKRLPEFHKKMEVVPHLVSESETFINLYLSGTGGLVSIVPYRWTSEMPSWLMGVVMHQPIWRWIAFTILLFVSVLLIITLRWAIYSLSKLLLLPRYYANWKNLSWVLSAIILLPFVLGFATSNLRISGELRAVFSFLLVASFFLLSAWAVWLSSNLILSFIIEKKNFPENDIDGQLVRLSLAVVASIIMAIILIIGAQKLGLPAYSIFAGLGVGGIAIALAAQNNLANLLGSLVIMLEKPFHVGQFIHTAGVEGIVERVGFRSVKIRTFYNSLVSVPSQEINKSNVDNLGVRKFRRTKSILRIGYETPAEKVEKFIEDIKKIILENEYTRSNFFQVALSEFGENSLIIVIYMFIDVPDWQTELAERQKILLKILQLAEKEGIGIASPTQIVRLEEPERGL
jgi:MscS family membrane protein